MSRGDDTPVDRLDEYDREILHDIREIVKETSTKLIELEKQFIGISGRITNFELGCGSCRSDVNDNLRKLKATVYGNGTPGLNLRVDRLEGAEGRRSWVLGVTVTAVIGLIISIIRDAIR